MKEVQALKRWGCVRLQKGSSETASRGGITPVATSLACVYAGRLTERRFGPNGRMSSWEGGGRCL